ncbi:MAG: hypothetical protein AB1465_07360 [Patescibacteria group bacterium]
MKILSIEESKQIATKFLKHIGKYNKEEVERYFSKKPSILNIPIIGFFIPLFVKKYRGYNRLIFTFSWPLTKKEADTYEDGLTLGTGGDYKILLDKKFFEGLKKTIRQHNITNVYAATDMWNFSFEFYRHRIISLSVDEINKRPIPIGLSLGASSFSSETFIFPKSFSFLFFISTGYLVELFGSKQFISDLKKNYPEHTKYLSHYFIEQFSRLKQGKPLMPPQSGCELE